MNPTDLRWNIMPIMVTVLGLLIALFLGVFIGGSELTNVAIFFGLLALIAFISTMRQYIWFLLPMFWGFTGSISVLPLPFSVRDLIVMLVATVALALFALRVLKFQNRWDFMDLILLLNVGQVCLAFVLHPAGLKALSSQIVGARPYFNVAIAALAYFILSNQVISAHLARRLTVCMVVAELGAAALYLLSRASGSIGFVLGKVYSGFFSPVVQTPLAPSVGRLPGVVRGGTFLVTALCSYFRPLTLINPFQAGRSFLFALGLVLVLLSGFRSQLLTITVIFLLASYFRKGWSDVMAALACLFVGIVVLISFNSFIHPLPLSMQRTLSALPGYWDSRAVSDAAGSTEWRLDMWKDLLKGSKYIHNRLLGDGFGFSQAELQALERQKYTSGDVVEQEDYMIIGAFHNGPLSAIRFVGIVGMVLYYTLIIYSAVYAWRLIRITRKTDFFPFALFVGLALIWEPFNYTLIFGAFDSGFPNALFNAGMLKLVHNSVVPATSQKEPSAKREPLLATTKRITVGAR